jgi:hypothetical protein
LDLSRQFPWVRAKRANRGSRPSEMSNAGPD